MYYRKRLQLLCLLFSIGALSCSSDEGGPVDTGGGNPTGRAVTRTIQPGGDTITASTGDGTSITIDFPPGAVRAPTAITLRPAAASGGSAFSVLLEPAGLVFLDVITITVTVPDGIALADRNLFFGDPADPVLIATTVDTSARTLTTAIRCFGLPAGNFAIASAPLVSSGPAAPQATAPNNLGALNLTCAQVAAQAQASFDALVAQKDYEHALAAALEAAALLTRAVCPEAQDWEDTAADLACTQFQSVISDAQTKPISSYGDFVAAVQPVINWAALAALYSPACPDNDTYTTAIAGKVDDFLAWYVPTLQAVTTVDFASFVALKQELLALGGLIVDAQRLGLEDAAKEIDTRAVTPTLTKMREVAYALGKNQRWHFALTKLTTYGFFSGRDILGVADPRPCDNNFSPPRCYQIPSTFGFTAPGPFTNEDIYEDLQYCGTALKIKMLASSGGGLDSTRAGGDGVPGQKTDKVTIKCPTRGTIQLGGEIAAMTCFTTNDDADDEIIVALNGTDVLTLRRPFSGDEYLQGMPAEIDVMQAADDAGITPMGGTSHDLALRRTRTNCSDLLWGEQDYKLVTATLEWEPPTLEAEVQMPVTVGAGATVDVSVRVKVIDQLGQAGFFDAIDMVLQSTGGSLQQTSGQTDAQGYFRTKLTVDASSLAANTPGGLAPGVQVDATATSFEGVTAHGSATATVLGPHAVLVGSLHQVFATARSSGCGASQCYDEQPFSQNSSDANFSGGGNFMAACGQATAQANVNAQGSTDAGSPGSVLTTISATVSSQSSVSSTTDDAAITDNVSAFDAWTFDVVEGNVNYQLSANGSHSGAPSNVSSGSTSFAFENVNSGVMHDFHLSHTSDALNVSGVLPPGRYRINMTAATEVSKACGPDAGSASATASGSFTLTLTTP